MSQEVKKEKGTTLGNPFYGIKAGIIIAVSVVIQIGWFLVGLQ